MKKFKLFFCILLSLIVFNTLKSAEQIDPIKVDWSFKGLLGKFDRASLQRGYQVYNEVCASCHSMQYLSYRNLGEPGGPEFSEEEVKAIAAGSTRDPLFFYSFAAVLYLLLTYVSMKLINKLEIRYSRGY